jgi:hypothetical protein
MDKTMMLYTTATNGDKTFSLIPLSDNCPFNEAIYMPKLEALAVLSKSTRDTFTMMERLDENGNPTAQVGKGGDSTKAKMQRVQISSPWEYFIHEKEEIRDFVIANAINSDTFSFQKYLTALELEVVDTPKIIVSQ